MTRARGCLFCRTGMLIGVFPLGLAAQELPVNHELQQHVALGFYSALGNYGAQDATRITYLPVSWAVTKGGWSGQLSLARLRVEGPGNVLVNLGGVTRAVASDSIGRYSGTGDSLVEIGYTKTQRIPEGVLPSLFGDSLSVGARLSVKLPTASVEKNLGTGERDVSLQLESSFYVGQNTVFTTLGYSDRGASQVFTDIKNSGYAQVGIARRLSQSTSAGLLYDYRETASKFFGDVQEVGVYAGWELSPTWSLTALASTGLTASSAEHAVYLQLVYQVK